MAKKMRRFLALMVALTLTAGQIVAPAMATGLDEAMPVAPAAQVTVTQIGNGTETVTVTIDTSTGTQTTTTEVSTNDTAAGTTTESTRTDTVTTNPEGTQTGSSSSWESKEVQTGSETKTEGSTTVQTDTNVTTTVEGSETSGQTITHDSETNVEIVEGKLSGEEATTVDGTTITTETTTGELLEEMGETIVDAPIEKELDSGSKQTETQWTEGEEKKEVTSDVDDEAVDKKVTTETTGPEDVTPKSGGATLNLTPNGQEVTVKDYITLEEVLAGTAMRPESTGTQTVKEIKDGKGSLIGWEIIQNTKTVDVDQGDPDTQTGAWGSDWEQTVTGKVRDSGKYTEGTTTEGNVTTTVEKIYDKKTGGFLGYKVTKVTVTESDNSEDPVVTESQKDTSTTKGTAQDNGFTLPEKPEERSETNAYGDTTTVTVTDLMENGKHVGYTISTVITSADGTAIRKETKNIYGTASTLTTGEVRDPVTEKTVTTTKITTTEVEEIYETEETRTMERTDTTTTNTTTTYLDETDTYQLVETDDGMFFLYKGVMYAVEAIGSHGNTTLTPITPDMDLVTAAEGSDVRNKNGTTNGLFTKLTENTGNESGMEFRYVGNGVASTLMINRWKPDLDDYGNLQYNKDGSIKMENGNLTNHQFALQDSSGKIHYVYCCDIATDAVSGYYYEMTNVEDANYYQGSNAVAHIQTIATRGFWGTKSGAGSLDAVKQLLKDSGYKNWNSLTEGQALTATQAAIWKYGNNDANRYLDETIVQKNYWGTSLDADHPDSANVQALFNLLISGDLMNKTDLTATDLIDKEDITGAAITVKEAVTDGSGNVVEDNNGNKKYNTNLSFTLKVDKNSITGNLKVYVYANGDTKNPIATRVLAGDGFLSYGLEPDANGTYTIEDLEIFEGVNITLNLEGTQDLERGVYLYTSEIYDEKTSQTFVGVAEGERKVDLEVSLKFEVEDPTINHTNTRTTTKITDKNTVTEKVTREDTRDVTNTAAYGTEKTEKFHDVDVYGTVTVTKTKKDITKEDRKWESYYQYLLQLINGEDGGGEEKDGRGNDLTTILDEDVALADAPKTGDMSALWAAISTISLGGMALLSVKRKEEE